MWMQDGCKVNMESFLASNQLWFTVTWIVLINHLLEVSLTQNQETMAQPLIYYILLCVQTPDERNSLKIAFGWGPNNIWIHTTLEGPCPHYMTLKVSWDCLLDTFFWALTTSWSRLMACVCEVESYIMCPYPCPWVLGGHGCIPASNSKSESNFSDVGNTLTKKRSRLKPATMNDLLFVWSNQDLV